MTASPPNKPINSLIQNLHDLRSYLVIALQIEHATIPPPSLAPATRSTRCQVTYNESDGDAK